MVLVVHARAIILPMKHRNNVLKGFSGFALRNSTAHNFLRHWRARGRAHKLARIDKKADFH